MYIYSLLILLIIQSINFKYSIKLMNNDLYL